MTGHLNPKLVHVGPSGPRRPRPPRTPQCVCGCAYGLHDPITLACTRCALCGCFSRREGLS